MKEFEQEIRQSESNFGHELMAKAEELFKKDAENEVAQYSFLNKDWKLLTKDLQQFGFKKFIDKAIGKTIFLIFPQKLKLVTIKKYGTFLMPPKFFLSEEKITIDEKGKGVSLPIKESGEINGFKLALATETIPAKENIFCQYQQLSLTVNTYNSHFLLKENFLWLDNQRPEKTKKYKIVEMKRANFKEIKLFQKILAKDLQKKLA